MFQWSKTSLFSWPVIGVAIFILSSCAVAEVDDVANGISGIANVSLSLENIEPKTLQIRPGDTVVWRNNGKESFLVRFVDNAVSTTCKAPHGFEIGSTGIYKSRMFGPGEIVSLCFLERKTYKYILVEKDQATSDSVRSGEEPRIFGVVTVE